MKKEMIVKEVMTKLAKKPSVEEAHDFILNKDKLNLSMEDLKKLQDKYDNKWLDAEVIEAKPSKYGKGQDIKVRMVEKDLPRIIETDMVKTDELEPKEKVKVLLYISPGGILVEKLKQLKQHTLH